MELRSEQKLVSTLAALGLVLGLIFDISMHMHLEIRMGGVLIKRTWACILSFWRLVLDGLQRQRSMVSPPEPTTRPTQVCQSRGRASGKRLERLWRHEQPASGIATKHHDRVARRVLKEANCVVFRAIISTWTFLACISQSPNIHSTPQGVAWGTTSAHCSNLFVSPSFTLRLNQ